MKCQCCECWAWSASDVRIIGSTHVVLCGLLSYVTLCRELRCGAVLHSLRVVAAGRCRGGWFVRCIAASGGDSRRMLE